MYDGSNIHGMWGSRGLESTLASSVTAIVKKTKNKNSLNVFFQCQVLIKGDTGGRGVLMRHDPLLEGC